MPHVHRYHVQAAAVARRLEKEKAGHPAPFLSTSAREDAAVLLRLGAVVLLAVSAVTAVLTFAA